MSLGPTPQYGLIDAMQHCKIVHIEIESQCKFPLYPFKKNKQIRNKSIKRQLAKENCISNPRLRIIHIRLMCEMSPTSCPCQSAKCPSI